MGLFLTLEGISIELAKDYIAITSAKRRPSRSWLRALDGRSEDLERVTYLSTRYTLEAKVPRLRATRATIESASSSTNLVVRH